MPDIPYATETETSYENFVAICPICGFRNIFNRVSDLKEVEPIAFKQVACEDCGKPFNINNDSINAAYEMLVYDCYNLMKEKHYCYCILNLAQAYEVFFSHYLRVELLYKPYWRSEDRNLDQLNRVSNLLFETIKNYTFAPLRSICINWVLSSRTVATLDESESLLNELNDLVGEPPDEKIADLKDKPLSELLLSLKKTKIGELRNQVVHKIAYRPTVEKVEASLEETRSILFPLASHLKVQAEDINSYVQHN